MNLEPVRNAISAKEYFEKSANELQHIDRMADSENKYHIRTDENGITTELIRDWLIVEVHESWYDDGSLYHVISLWQDTDY